MKRLVRVLLLLSLVLLPKLSSATLSVSFTASNTTGCDSLFAYFTPTTTGCATGTSPTYRWYFVAPGTGGDTTISSIPNFTFNIIGTWHVFVKAFCGTDSAQSTGTTDIIISSSPTIDFTSTSPATDTGLVCGPHTVHFINTSSTVGSTCSGSATPWRWIVSGPTGGSSITSTTGTDYTYRFVTAGTYTVTLLYFAPACGCFGSVTKANIVRIDVLPTPCFGPHDTVMCHSGSVTFDAGCSIGAYSYAWIFGDGGTGTGSPVTHYYSATGYSFPRLVAYSLAGCADTTRAAADTVFVGNLTDTITATPSSTSVCDGTTVTYIGSASDASATHYFTTTFGGSVIDFDAAGTYAFTPHGAGTYTIADLATDAGGCTAVAYMTLTVRPTPALDSISADHLFNCDTPLTVHFTPHFAAGYSTSGLTYAWTFNYPTGTGVRPNTSTIASPTATYSTTGMFTPRLIVTDATGCADTVTRNNYVDVGRYTVVLTKSADSGRIARVDSACIGQTVDFTVNVKYTIEGTDYDLPFALDSLYYGVGDADTCIGAACAASSYTYTTAGSTRANEHIIRVVGHLLGFGGCHFVYLDSIKMGSGHPSYSLSVSPNDSVCPNTTVQFQAHCTNCSWYDWSIHVPGLTPLYTTSGPPAPVSCPTCPSSDTTSAPFGPVTTGTPPGRYPWTLIMSFNGCTDTLNDTITVFGPRQGTVGHSIDCRFFSGGRRDSVNLTLSGAASIRIIGGAYHVSDDTTNYWYDGTSATGPWTRFAVHHPATSGTTIGTDTITRHFLPGWHYIRVHEFADFDTTRGCGLWSLVDSFFIGAPNPAWYMDSILCVGGTSAVHGPIQPDGTDYSDYYWHWGDGTVVEHGVSSSNAHTYTATGSFHAYVVVANSDGCLDTARIITVNVVGPSGGITVSDTMLCDYGTFTFTDHNTSPGYAIASRRWADAPVGGTLYGSGISQTISFATRGYHVVYLTDVDGSPSHCSTTQSIRVRTDRPYAYFTSPDSADRVCAGVAICFHDTNTHCSYSWNFGDGPWTTPSATAHDTCHIYSYNGSFTVQCAIFADGTGGYPAGCSDTFKRVAYINAGALVVTSTSYGDGDSVSCPPLHVVRYADSAGNSYVWHIAPLPSLSPMVTVTGSLLNYNISGTGSYRVTMIGTSPRGCVDSVSYDYFIGGPTGFISLSDTIGCTPDTIAFHFTNTGTAISSTYIWNVCPYGTITSTGDITLVYSVAGTYCPPTLTIQSGTCVVNITNLTDSIRIHPLPTVSIAGVGILCYGSSTTLIASGADSYTWSPAATFGSLDTAHAGASVSPTVTTTYTVTGSTIYGCIDTATTTVVVDPPIHMRIAGHDSVCIGVCDTLIASGVTGASYIWRGIGTSCAVCDTNVVCITSTHTYTISVTDGNGCSDSTTFKVTVNPAPILHYTPAEPHVCYDDGFGTQITMTGAATYVWRPRAGLDNDSIANPTCFSPSNIIYSVTGTSIYGCRDSITVPVVVYYKHPVSISADTSICRGTSAHLIAKGGESYTWTPDDNTIDDATSYRPNVSPTVTTIYHVTVHENVCYDTPLHVKVRVVQLPILSVPPGATILAGNTYQLYANLVADNIDTNDHSFLVNFMWTPVDSSLSCFDCPRPIATPYITTTYSVVASTIEGCAGSATVTVKVLCEGSQVFIPNTFTPNGDGVNDLFYVSGKGLGLVTKMVIYNRWGEQVYSGANLRSNDPGSGWDGTYKGSVLPPDVYIYVIQVECTTGEPFDFKGDITLIR